MSKKNLTDLLREEVKKSSELTGETVQEITDDGFVEQEAETVEESPMNTPAKRPIPTKAQLETTITELKAALEEAQHKETTITELKAALEEAQHKETTFSDLKEALEESHRKEGSLKEKVAHLEADLEEQKKSVHKLEKEVEKIGQLKTELEQAKRAALQLAEANEKLTQEVNTFKKGKEDIKVQGHEIVNQLPKRPIQKESEKPIDFATKSWLL